MQQQQTTKQKKVKMILIIAVAVLIYFAGNYILSRIKPEKITPTPDMAFPTQTLGPTPTSIVNAKAPPKQKSLKPGLIPLLPTSTDTYEIEYWTTSDTFSITIKESPYEQNKKSAEQWFIDHGVSNLKDLKIIYNKYRGVQ